MSHTYDPKQHYLFRAGINVYAVDWPVIRQYPLLDKACQQRDQLDLFRRLDENQAFCCIRIMNSQAFDIGNYIQPVVVSGGDPLENACDLFIYHFKIYEFAARYDISNLKTLSFYYLKVAADKLSYYVLAGTLSKMNYAFSPQETDFIAYMRERSQMQNETLTPRDHAAVMDDWQYSMTLENFLLGQIIMMKLHIQKLEADADPDVTDDTEVTDYTDDSDASDTERDDEDDDESQ
ncbi:unnamed protein product [Fusarium graminearum]|nr:hypothetical protein FAUST_11580 [Fusarium austroamericanum]KAI6763511.1 hypothetical protein HG531_012899 [Fusarium graminearum]PCD33841.1 hypothetical protein FGRA07_08996 [Fusarium graminearum]CAF3431890.1 unnamed protein product [Fusarium graminearum]CAF3476775.1 unnamed protein product [Fusarium graminearum]